jgi:hypothetical protein
MVSLRRCCALTLFFALGGLLLSAVSVQAPPQEKKAAETPAKKWLIDHTLAVTPAPAPVPALEYRLFPTFPERKDGNAVPIYLRFAHERPDATKKQLREKPEQWNKLPLDKLPLAEVKEFLDRYKYNFKQLELGARRKTADWNYTLDAGNPIGLLLPDAQEMRLQVPLLVLKARVEIAEGRYTDAVHTLQTGFSFSQQVSQAPFLISSLVAIACANQFADCVLELMQRPDAPNLYWALTVLPRPLIDLRTAYEFEHNLLELQFPDLADLKRPRTPEEWEATLTRLRREIDRFRQSDAGSKPPRPGTRPGDPASKSPDLPVARKYLAEVARLPAARLDAMSPAELLLLYQLRFLHEIRDELFKVAYLPFPQTRAPAAEVEKALRELPDTEAAVLPRMFLPALVKVRFAEVRLERKLAMLRTIEALRMHAASQGGRLPDKLDQVTVVPIPNDPGTDQPFEYQRDGQEATLSNRIPGQPLEREGLRYRMTLRK